MWRVEERGLHFDLCFKFKNSVCVLDYTIFYKVMKFQVPTLTQGFTPLLPTLWTTYSGKVRREIASED